MNGDDHAALDGGVAGVDGVDAERIVAVAQRAALAGQLSPVRAEQGHGHFGGLQSERLADSERGLASAQRGVELKDCLDGLGVSVRDGAERVSRTDDEDAGRDGAGCKAAEGAVAGGTDGGAKAAGKTGAAGGGGAR